MSVFIKFYYNTATSICLSIVYGALALQQQSWVAETEAMWQQSLKYLLSGSLQKSFWTSCLDTASFASTIKITLFFFSLPAYFLTTSCFLHCKNTNMIVSYHVPVQYEHNFCHRKKTKKAKGLKKKPWQAYPFLPLAVSYHPVSTTINTFCSMAFAHAIRTAKNNLPSLHLSPALEFCLTCKIHILS